MKLVSIVVPVFNEEDNIQHFYESVCENMAPLPYDFELVFVDDGSKDRSREILRSLEQKDKRVQSIFLARNSGHQLALTCGLDHADGDAVITMDGDMQHPPELIPVLLEKWDEYERLTEILIKDGFVKAPEKQRFYYCGIENVRYEVDIVPFGDIAQEEMVAWPPEGNPVMSVRCFADVMTNADEVSVEDRFDFRMASLSGQWLIKLDAWCDRRLMTRKDAADMQFILENAYITLALSSDSIPGTISLDVSTFDQTVAGAEWIASDLLNILSEDHKVYYADMLDNEVAQQENSPLVNDLLDNAVIGTYDSIRRALARMSQILRR